MRLLALLALLLLAGCPKQPHDQNIPAGMGRLTLTVAAPGEVAARAVPAVATSFELRVAAAGMTTITATAQRPASGSVQLSVDVPAGKARVVTVNAYDATGYMVATGNATTDIAPAVANTVNLVLKDTGGVTIIIS